MERKSTRQRSANDQRAAAGGRPAAGRRAYGYSSDGLLQVPAEAKHLRWAVERLLAGDSLHGIARVLNDRGARTAAGNPWRPTQLRRTLQNPRNAGLRVHRGDVVGPGSWPALYDEGTHAAVLAVLADPQRHRAGPPRRYLLSGVATCGVCGGKVFGVGEKAKGPLYRCETRLHVNRRAEPVDELLAQVVVARLEQPDAVSLVAAPADVGEVATLRAKNESLRQRLDHAAEAFAAGDIDRRQLTAATASLRTQLEQVSTELAEHARTPVLSELLATANVRGTWNGLSMNRQRAVIGTLATVQLMPPGRGARVFDPESVRINWRTF